MEGKRISPVLSFFHSWGKFTCRPYEIANTGEASILYKIYKYGQSYTKVYAPDYGRYKKSDGEYEFSNWSFFKYWTTDPNEIENYPQYFRKEAISKADGPSDDSMINSKFFEYAFESNTKYSLVNLYTTYDYTRFIHKEISVYGEDSDVGTNRIVHYSYVTLDRNYTEGDKVKIRELMSNYKYTSFLSNLSEEYFSPPYYGLHAVGDNAFDESGGVDIEVDGKKVDKDFEYTIKPFISEDIKVTYHKLKRGRLTLNMTNSGYTGEIPNTRHRVIGSNPAVLEYKIGDYLHQEDEPKLGPKNGKEFDGWYYKQSNSEYKFYFGETSSYSDPNDPISVPEEYAYYRLYDGQDRMLYPKWET